MDIHPAVRSLIGSTVGMAALQVDMFLILNFLASLVAFKDLNLALPCHLIP